jgi:hypothetical protein
VIDASAGATTSYRLQLGEAPKRFARIVVVRDLE